MPGSQEWLLMRTSICTSPEHEPIFCYSPVEFEDMDGIKDHVQMDGWKDGWTDMESKIVL